MRIPQLAIVPVFVVALLNCGQEGPAGPAGEPGAAGTNGTNGTNGGDGVNGEGGTNPDGGVIAPIAPTSGTRIKAMYSTVTTTMTTPDGAKSVASYQLQYWFDSQRNEPCSFVPSADSKYRCMPTTPLAVYDSGSGSYYSDAVTCAQPLVFQPKTAAPGAACPGPTSTPAPGAAKYILTSGIGAPGCGGSRIRPIGTPITPGATIYIKSGTSCVGTPSSPTLFDYFTPGAEIPATDFVESTTNTVTL